MPAWLLLKTRLHFNPNLRPIYSNNYRPDLLPEGGDVYYGVHFVSAPNRVNPGDDIIAELLVRAFPRDPCIDLQAGKKILLTEGPTLTRAEGKIIRRWEFESPSRTILELQQELTARDVQ